MKDDAKKAMFQLVCKRGVEGDSNDLSRSGLAGVACITRRKTEERDCIIEAVDQCRLEVKVYDRVEKDIIVRPIWQLLKLGDLDLRCVSLQ